MPHSFKNSFEGAAISAIKENRELTQACTEQTIALRNADYEIRQILDILNNMEPNSMISTETVKSWFRSVQNILN